MMVCEPTERVEIVSVAEPETIVAAPRRVVPSVKVTEPVMVPVPAPGVATLTPAMRLSGAPALTGFALDVSVVTVGAWMSLTTWMSGCDTAAELLESPL